MIIGVTGTIGSGKDTVANYFVKKKGFTKIIMSDFLRKIERHRKVKPLRDNLRRLQHEIKQRYGEDILVEMAISEIAERDLKKAVVSGIRYPEEAKLFKKKVKMPMIFVDADPKQRFLRLKKRDRQGDPKTSHEFDHFDAIEEATFHLSKTKKLADFQIDNSKTLDHLEKQIQRVIKKLKI
ncbi:MAG: dephospho-CoA kinase [archaeon]|nr:MAG: dephospho-CoA kinase [archaeon]